MFRYIIPIIPETLDLIAEMNGGVKPALEEDATTFFVWNGPLEYSDIVTVTEDETFWDDMGSWSNWTILAQQE